MKHDIEYGTTEQFAELFLVKPDTVRRRYCLTGSYNHVIPQKLMSGRLRWPLIDPQDVKSSEEVAA